MALVGIFSLELNSPMITIHNGKMAPMMAPRPADIYLTPQVLRPLLIIKFKKHNTNTGIHSRPFGKGAPLYRKKAT